VFNGCVGICCDDASYTHVIAESLALLSPILPPFLSLQAFTPPMDGIRRAGRCDEGELSDTYHETSQLIAQAGATFTSVTSGDALLETE
jgi:hypothetical protein